MTGIEIARQGTKEGAQLVRARKDAPGQYDVKPLFTGSKRGWFILDSFSASAIVAVYDALSEANREKYAKFHLAKMAEIAFKLLNKQSARATA